MTDTKIDRLRQSGTLNPRPDTVTDALFQDSAFFDPRDLLQVRYEMVRCNAAGRSPQGSRRAVRDVGTHLRARPTGRSARAACRGSSRSGAVRAAPTRSRRRSSPSSNSTGPNTARSAAADSCP